jgi:RNA polymerase sigma-70 factor, ECF subfamily
LDSRNAGPDPLQIARPAARKGADAVGDAGRDEIKTWVAQHWNTTYNLLYRLTMNRHDAEELTQETFLRAIERRSSFKTGSNLKAWLLRIATNAFLDGRRRKKVMKIEPLTEEAPEIPGNGRRTGQGLEDRELYAGVEAAIAELPQTARVVFLLRSQQDLSFREIAETIGTSEETARWHMMQARKQLMSKLNGQL